MLRQGLNHRIRNPFAPQQRDKQVSERVKAHTTCEPLYLNPQPFLDGDNRTEGFKVEV